LRRLADKMSSWSAINSSGDDENAENHVTKEGVEHSLRSLYEGAINSMSNSIQTGDEHWMTAKNALLLLLQQTNQMEDTNKRNKLEYLALKNLSRVHERESNFSGAMEDALNALDISPSDVDTHLLTRIAFLSLQIGDKWTCQTLLFSGRLSAALSSTVLEIHRRWQTTSPLCSDDALGSNSCYRSAGRPIIAMTVVDAQSVVSCFSITLHCLTSELLRIGRDNDVSGSTFVCVSSNPSLIAFYETCLATASSDSNESSPIPSSSGREGMVDYESGDGDQQMLESDTADKSKTMPNHEIMSLKGKSSIYSKRSRSAITATSSDSSSSSALTVAPVSGEVGNEGGGEVEESTSNSSSKRSTRRKSSRQVARKLRDPEFDYSATSVKSGVALDGRSWSDVSGGIWEGCRGAVEEHLTVSQCHCKDVETCILTSCFFLNSGVCCVSGQGHVCRQHMWTETGRARVGFPGRDVSSLS
jgi:hypothetical protein